MKYWQGLVSIAAIVTLGSVMQYWGWSWFPAVGLCTALAFLVGVSRGGQVHLEKADKSSWDRHNCRMPNDMPILTAEGNIWNCHCGRRWKFVRYEKPSSLPGGGSLGTFLWEEWTPEKELAEADKKLKKMGLSGTPLPSTLDAIERDR